VADQTDNVYRFEDDWSGWNRNQFTLAECRLLIRSALDLYGCPPVTVAQHKRRSLSWCCPSVRRMSLQAKGPNNLGGKNAATCLHEAAHQIGYDLYGQRIDDHGPTFVGIYLALLVKAKVAPGPALEAQLRHRGVKWRTGVVRRYRPRADRRS